MSSRFHEAWRFIRSNPWQVTWRAFLRRDTHPLLQFVKYGFSGAAAFVTHQIIWAALSLYVLPAIDPAIPQDERALNSAINNCIAFFVSTTVAYVANVLWVFTPGRHSRVLEILYFFVVGSVGLAGGLLAGPWMIKVFGLDTLVAQLSMALASVLINYVCRKFFIFKH